MDDGSAVDPNPEPWSAASLAFNPPPAAMDDAASAAENAGAAAGAGVGFSGTSWCEETSLHESRSGAGAAGSEAGVDDEADAAGGGGG